MSAGSVCKSPRFFNRGILGLELEKIVKTRSQILNEGLGVSVSLGFYHSIHLCLILQLHIHVLINDTLRLTYVLYIFQIVIVCS